MTEINNLYEIKLNANKYNLFIRDGIVSPNDYAIITVKAIDFNGNPIINKNISVSCDKGHIYKNTDYNKVQAQNPSDIHFDISPNQVTIQCGDSIEPGQELSFTITINNGLNDISRQVSYTIDENNMNLLFTTQEGSSDTIRSINNISLNSIISDNILYTGFNNNLDDLGLQRKKTITGTTNDEGYFDLIFDSKTDWGLCTISADVNKIQCFVRGFKETNLATNTSVYAQNFQVDESIRACRLLYSISAQTIPKSSIQWKDSEKNIIPTKYRPKSIRYYLGYSNRLVTILQINGSIGIRTDNQNDFNMGSSDAKIMEWRY